MLYTPKPYKQFSRAINQWITVYPKPEEFMPKRDVRLVSADNQKTHKQLKNSIWKD